MANELAGQVISVIADVLDMDPAEISLESRFLQDLGASSLDLAELVWQLEDNPHLKLGQIPDEAIEGFVTVGDVVAFLSSQVPDRGPQAPIPPRVLIASDHAGFVLKATLIHHLETWQIPFADLGTGDRSSVDFTEYAEAVAVRVAQGQAASGILIGATGIGMAIAANKITGIRAAVVHDLLSARLSRQRYDVNVLCLGASLLGEEVARCCVEEFLGAAFEPGRDNRWARQISRIHEMEKRRLASS